MGARILILLAVLLAVAACGNDDPRPHASVDTAPLGPFFAPILRDAAAEWNDAAGEFVITFDPPYSHTARFGPSATKAYADRDSLTFDESHHWGSCGLKHQLPDFRSVALHELGHAIGLGHSNDPVAAMYILARLCAHLTDSDLSALDALLHR